MTPPIFPSLVPSALIWAVVTLSCLSAYEAPDESQKAQLGMRPMLQNNIDRPLRYSPENGSFVIVNGREFFNRSLYGGSSAFRVDAGDMPEFSFYLPGAGGNLRIGFATISGAKWLHQAERVTARYKAGRMIYRIQDPLLGPGEFHLTALAPKEGEGLLLELASDSKTPPLTIHLAFGGITGVRGGRDGDVGSERLPVREYFRFKPENCRENHVAVADHRFVVSAPAGAMIGLLPQGSTASIGDATTWHLPVAENTTASGLPIARAAFPLPPAAKDHLGLQFRPHENGGQKAAAEVLEIYRDVTSQDPSGEVDRKQASPWSDVDLANRFKREADVLDRIANRVTIQTPDPFVNAAMPALAVAEDAVWDDRSDVYLHGGVAWRMPLLGWRVAYAGDAFGLHERTRAHFDRYAKRQNVTPPPDRFPEGEPESLLARNANALHSNGDMMSSHYDMNLVGVDTIFRHLLWTGDIEYARSIWPVIERHLAWERRLFRREFGPEKLPLYEAYACIWASDSLAYNGGGATHSTAYNLYHNRMAARIARILGKDPAPYQNEASLIEKGMNELLWLKDRGWFAEWKDLLGDQAAHPEAAAWTFYHTLDSEVPDSLKAWQMSRFVKNNLPRIPVRGPGVPEGLHTIATSTWMPYVWSLNNVVMAESMHTAHALWQAGDSETAFQLFKGAILDSMYLGICPGNIGMCTWLDASRRETYRDFSDGVGATARAFLEGLFGITPDMLTGELTIRPGFPSDWNEASIHQPSFDFSFRREDLTERFSVASRFAKPVAVKLIVPALRDDVASVTANGANLPWKLVADSVAAPRIEITTPASATHEIVIRWQGARPASAPAELAAIQGNPVTLDAGAPVEQLEDPQSVLSDARSEGRKISGKAVGTVGHRTVFARVRQGDMQWWQPLSLRITEASPPPSIVFNTDWSKPLDPAVKLDIVPLDAAFNAKVREIFRQDYVSPRSPYVSLALPRHGYGSWCHPKKSYDIDDSGIRALAAKNDNRILLPNGVPLATPGDATANNIAFVSRWDNFPGKIRVPLSGKASKIHLLMAGSTDGMKSRRDNGEILIHYTDGTTTRLALDNPGTWWPIDQDYFIDDHAFKRPGPLPVRVDLRTGKIRVLDEQTFAGKGRRIAGGAATVLDLDLDPSKELKSMTFRAIANEVVIGLMSATLQRP